MIRSHALGKFEDLLVATAQRPAMLFYLDNWLSVGQDSEVGLGISPRNRNQGHGRRAQNRPVKDKAKAPSGLNENYGRELMELHTLSVNGGYTQKDVTEVAKVFTGWTLDRPRKRSRSKGSDKKRLGFPLRSTQHEPGDKTVLGPNQRGGKEGLEVLRCWRAIQRTGTLHLQKLAMRFVADDPPPALVDRMTQTFLKKRRHSRRHADDVELARILGAKRAKVKLRSSS